MRDKIGVNAELTRAQFYISWRTICFDVIDFLVESHEAIEQHRVPFLAPLKMAPLMRPRDNLKTRIFAIGIVNS